MFIRKLLTLFTDILFPPSPEEKILLATKLEDLYSIKQAGTFRQIEYLYRYSEPVIKTAILENKFHHNHTAAKLLGGALEKWVAKQTQNTIYIPIPLGKKRLRERGHNQVETILQSTQTKINISNNLLRRKVETAPQSHLDKKARLENMQDVFEFDGAKLDFKAGTKIVLVDDVATTGATLLAARASLAPHLPPQTTLTCLAIAH